MLMIECLITHSTQLSGKNVNRKINQADADRLVDFLIFTLLKDVAIIIPSN